MNISRTYGNCLRLGLFFWISVATGRAAAEPADNTKVLVLEFEVHGDESDLARPFQTKVIDLLNARTGFAATAFKMAQTRAIGTCGTDCLEQAVETLHPDYLLRGSVGIVFGEHVASLTLIDAQTMRAVGGESRTFAAADEVIAAVPTLLGQTFAWPDTPQITEQTFSLPRNRTMSFALMDLGAFGLDADEVKNTTQILSNSLKQIQGAQIITFDDIRAMLELEASRQLLGCDNTSCMAEIGGAVGADRMIAGSVGQMGERYIVSLRLIDPAEAKVEARVTESFVGDATQLLPAVRFSGKKLLGALGDSSGALAISANEESAAVFVNETERGALPMKALPDLEPGRYSLRLAKDGFHDWRSDIYIEPGNVTPIWAEMNEREPEFYETWWFWTAVGAVVVGTGTYYIVNESALPDTQLGNVRF